jgi:hypothetical protein
MMLYFLLPFIGCFLVLMVDYCLEAFSLVPSQVIRRSKHLTRQQNQQQNPQPVPSHSLPTLIPYHLIPSQVLRSTKLPESVPTDNTAASEQTGDDALNQRRKGRRRPKKKKPPKDKPRSSMENTFPLEGNLPDIFWRAIPMPHLRTHPAFDPLPAVVTQNLESLEDARKFRQESWQWEELHKGRCTTSQAVAALGFLEPNVGQILRIPASWWRGGRGAYARLREPGLRTLDEMNTVLRGANPYGNPSKTADSSSASSGLWSTTATSSNSSLHVAQYHYTPTEDEQLRRRVKAQKLSNDENLAKSIRMEWGNTQESTSILTALNYFSKIDPGLVVKEVGMCGAGLNLNQNSTIASSLLVGATPDAVLCYADGSIEALEVKNHCPFLASRTFQKKGKRSKNAKRFFIGDRSFESEEKKGSVFSHYVPQLQLEMLCLGPECRSAVMVRQTATKGALVLRMHRDDEWIAEMLYWLHSFQSSFVEKDRPPPHNFFWDNSDLEERKRYRRFVNSVEELKSTRVDIVAVIPSHEIQRVEGAAPLFLDQVARASRE